MKKIFVSEEKKFGRIDSWIILEQCHVRKISSQLVLRQILPKQNRTSEIAMHDSGFADFLSWFRHATHGCKKNTR